MGGRELGSYSDGGKSSYSDRLEHPQKQVAKRREEKGRGRAFGTRDRAIRDAGRAKRIERSEEEFQENLDDDPQEGLRYWEKRRRYQIEEALRHVLAGTATPEWVAYFLRHSDELGQTETVDRTTIVGLSPTKKELPDAA